MSCHYLWIWFMTHAFVFGLNFWLGKSKTLKPNNHAELILAMFTVIIAVISKWRKNGNRNNISST